MNTSKPQLSSIEIIAIVKDMQFLIGGKINQVYETEEKDFFFQVHVSGKGRQIIRIRPGRFICITETKPFMSEPGGFCMQLRKILNGSFIESIQQIEAQRIVRIDFRSDKRYQVYIELFSKGNIVLCDKDDNILGLLSQQSWKEREVKVHQKYKVPAQEINFLALGKNKLYEILNKSEKAAVTCIATETGLGGLYSEEICFRAGIDKKVQSSQLSRKENDRLFGSLHEIIEEIKRPKGYIFEGMIAPTALKTHQHQTIRKTFSEAVDEIVSRSKIELEKEKKETQYKQKLQSVQNILDKQKEQLTVLEAISEESTKKGDWLYENYQGVKELLDKIKDIRDNEGWNSVEDFLRKRKKIKQVDMKDKRVIVDL